VVIRKAEVNCEFSNFGQDLNIEANYVVTVNHFP